MISEALYYFPMEDILNETIEASSLIGLAIGQPELSTGMLGSAFFCNQDKQYIQFDDVPHGCPLDPGLCSGGYTISTWLKFPNYTVSNSVTIFKIGYHDDTAGMKWKLKSNGVLMFRARAENATEVSVVTLSAPQGMWFHIMLTYKNTLEPTLYLNGTHMNDAEIWTSVEPKIGAPFESMWIGCITNGDTIWMDEIYIWTRYMDEMEAASIYHGI